MEEFVQLNISGKRYQILGSKFGGHCINKETFLTRFLKLSHAERVPLCDKFISDHNEYFFSRCGKYFDPVFDFEATGELHRPSNLCPHRFLRELEFWEIPESQIYSCCAVPTSSDTSEPSDSDLEANHAGDLQLITEPDPFEGRCAENFRRKTWAFTEDPSSSIAAKIFVVVSLFFIFVSVSGLILSSLPDLQKSDGDTHEAFDYVEYVCISYFTIEYLLRWGCAPKKWAFMKETLNVIDLVSIIPFYPEFILTQSGISFDNFTGIKLVMRMLRVARVARIFKLARYSSGLRSFGMTLKKSMSALGMLGVFLGTAVVFFSTVIYFLEKDEENTKFTSIPAACWWCLITMTTVGYGDYVPTTVGGQLVASLACLAGVLVLAFPITMIVDNFNTTFKEPSTAEEPKLSRKGGMMAF